MFSKENLPIVLAAGCMFVYALVIVMLKRFSATYNVFVLGVSYLPIQLGLMMAMYHVSSSYWMTEKNVATFSFPVGNAWWLIALVGILYTLGSTLNYQSYAMGGKVQMVSAMTLLLPVFSSLIVFVLDRELPNRYQLGAYACGAIMIALLIKGNGR